MIAPNETPHRNETLAVGIDLGGTKIAAALVAFPAGEIRAKETIPTLPARGGDAVLTDTVDLARRMTHHAEVMGKGVIGIGVGIAELVSLDGQITSDYIIKWRDLAALEIISQIAPACFESDARAPALAEARFGAGKAYKNFVYVSVGTGISYCLVLDGRPYHGAHGHAIIVGSGPLSSECSKCGTLQDQVLEEFAAGPSLVARYNRQAKIPVMSGEDVTTAAASGDSAAQQVVRSAAASLGNSIGFLVNVLDPEAVIVGGGLGLSGGMYWDCFVTSTRAHIWSDISRTLPIVPAALGNNAGVIGAAACALERFRTPPPRQAALDIGG